MHCIMLSSIIVFNKIRKTLVNERFAINEKYIVGETEFDSSALNIKIRSETKNR